MVGIANRSTGYDQDVVKFLDPFIDTCSLLISAFKESNHSNDRLKIKLSTEKSKSVKEKNNKNQITKYTINIKSVIDFDFIDQNYKKTFVILKKDSYNVDKNHSTTLKNLKNLENNLSEKVSNEIILNLIKIVNEL